MEILTRHVSPNSTLLLQNGQTALSIAQKLGYISLVETLKVVTDTVVTTTTTTTVEEKYKVLAPESMQETFMSDSEDEGGECKFWFFPGQKQNLNVPAVIITSRLFEDYKPSLRTICLRAFE